MATAPKIKPDPRSGERPNENNGTEYNGDSRYREPESDSAGASRAGERTTEGCSVIIGVLQLRLALRLWALPLVAERPVCPPSRCGRRLMPRASPPSSRSWCSWVPRFPRRFTACF